MSQTFEAYRASLNDKAREYVDALVASGSEFDGYGTFVGPGKFESEHWSTMHFYNLTLEGGQDTEWGDVHDDGEWCGEFTIPVDEMADYDIERSDVNASDFIEDSVFFVVSEDGLGFVRGTVWPSSQGPDYDDEGDIDPHNGYHAGNWLFATDPAPSE
jgi:hypothetical protein